LKIVFLHIAAAFDTLLRGPIKRLPKHFIQKD